jgi:hypothetical protein
LLPVVVAALANVAARLPIVPAFLPEAFIFQSVYQDS